MQERRNLIGLLVVPYFLVFPFLSKKVLHYVHMATHKALARLMGVSEKTIQRYLRRADKAYDPKKRGGLSPKDLNVIHGEYLFRHKPMIGNDNRSYFGDLPSRGRPPVLSKTDEIAKLSRIITIFKRSMKKGQISLRDYELMNAELM